MTGGDVTVGYEIADDPGIARHRAPRRSNRRAGVRLFGASRCARPTARPALLVSLLQRRRRKPRRTRRRRCRRRTPRPSGCALAFVSCANYEHGYFSAYRHLADENPEFVLFLGDYIYETHRGDSGRRCAATRTASKRRRCRPIAIAMRNIGSIRTCSALHAEVPALVTWDDHEVQNDYADKWSERFDDPEMFLLRRAAAYQAFYEHMPVRPICRGRTGRACGSMTASPSAISSRSR